MHVERVKDCFLSHKRFNISYLGIFDDGPLPFSLLILGRNLLLVIVPQTPPAQIFRRRRYQQRQNQSQRQELELVHPDADDEGKGGDDGGQRPFPLDNVLKYDVADLQALIRKKERKKKDDERIEQNYVKINDSETH